MKTPFTPSARFCGLMALTPCLCGWLWLGAPDAFGAEAAETKPKAKSPPTHTVRYGPLKGQLKINAVFEAKRMAPLSLQPKEWANLTVVEAVPHGTRVQKGEVILRLETEDLKEQIEEMERNEPSAALALELAKIELANLEQTTPWKLEAAERAKNRATEDWDYFDRVGREERRKAARHSVKSAEQSLMNAEEELRQLKKMYEADDLTEETEEIVLKRQEWAVESARYYLERSLETLIPREEEDLKTQKRDQEVAFEMARQTLPRNLEQKRLAVQKMERDREKAQRKLANLKKDLKQMTVRAPFDGVVYYGDCQQGKWVTAAALAKKLVPGGKLMPREIFMTVADPTDFILRAVVQEGQLAQLKPGLEGKAHPTAWPDESLQARVTQVNYVPEPTGGYLATLGVERAKELPVMPGMTCEVEFKVQKKAKALLVPKKAVFTEDNAQVVYLPKPKGEPERRVVKTGESDDSMIEIVEGLSEGEKVLLEKPSAPSSSK